MGGYGSDRKWHYHAKETTEDYLALDINYLHQNNLLYSTHQFSLTWSRNDKPRGSISILCDRDQLTLVYRHQVRGQSSESITCPVSLSWSNCHFGGRRPWFHCPVRKCNRRVSKLYGGKIFACRHCQRLAYKSQRESSLDRNLRKANKLRDKLDWMPGILNPTGNKPKGMHRATFLNLQAQHQKLLQKACEFTSIELKLGDDYFD